MHIVSMVIIMTGHSHSRVVHVIERTLNGRVMVTFSHHTFSGQALGVGKFTSFFRIQRSVFKARARQYI